MGRWCGMIGYGIARDNTNGVWDLEVVERPYYGDTTRIMSSVQRGDSLNDDIELRNDVSIVADAYAYQNFASMRYVTIMGVRWKVKSVEVERPRLLISIGGVYNGPTPETSEPPEDSSGD